jgi:hypothetical protein
MELKDLLGKTVVLKTIRTTYRGGAEHLSLTFRESETGKKVRVSITPERGSDLWITVQNKKEKSSGNP